VDACGDCQHAEHKAAMRHGELEEQIGKVGGALVPVLGEGAVGGFKESLPISQSAERP
jgi:hypothetical protein